MAYLRTSADDLIVKVERDTERPTRRTSLIAHPHPDSLSLCCAKKVSRSPRHILLSSKPAIFILLWTIIVGSIYSSAIYAIPLAVPSITQSIGIYGHVLLSVSAINVVLALTMILYPLGGLLGDVRLGRYRTVIIGLTLLLACMVTASIDSVLLVKFNVEGTLGNVSIRASFFHRDCSGVVCFVCVRVLSFHQ